MVAAPPAPSLLPLRDYQRAALDAILAAEREGITRQLVAMPTGSGKTALASHLIREAAQPRGWVTVFIVHRDELARQSVAALGQVNPDLAVGVCKAERDDLHANVIVASAQTLAQRRRLDRLTAATRQAPGLLWISDECHHDLAPSRVRAISESAPDLLVGLTATPERGDGGRLGNIYQQITFQVGMLELMARGRLARLVGVRVGTDVSLDAVRTTAGELNEGDLEHAVDTPERNRLIVAGWRRHAATRTRTVVFCVTVAHAEHVAEAFAAAGVSVATVFGHTPTEERQETFRRFHEGEIRVLVNVMVLTEGYDEPAIDCVVVARPTKSRGLYVQMVGRGARTFPDKQDCLVLDVVDISSRHKLVGMASLTSDRSELAGAATDDEPEPEPEHDQPFDLLERAEALERRRREREEQQARLSAEADAGKARLASETKAVNLYAASPWLWQESKGVHYAPAGDGLWLVIKPQPDGFRPYLLQSDRTTRTAELTELFDRPLDFEMAMGIAHDRAPQLPVNERRLYDRAATWRTQTAPPSPAQIAAAQKWRIPLTGRETKAEVSKLMDEAAFGAAHWRATRGRNH